jgi:hypothetical protein
MFNERFAGADVDGDGSGPLPSAPLIEGDRLRVSQPDVQNGPFPERAGLVRRRLQELVSVTVATVLRMDEQPGNHGQLIG